MKQPNKIPLTSIIRALEKDFKSASKNYNNSLKFAISSLMSGEFENAKSQFNKCIEQDSDNPAGWLGRAYVEVINIEPIEINDSNPDEFVLRAKELDDSGIVDKYLDGLSAIIAFQHAAAIKMFIDYTIDLREQEARAAFNAIAGTALGLAGATVGKTSKSLVGKIAGYSMLGAGAGIAINQGMNTTTFKRIKNSAFADAIAQTYLSIPIISYCYQMYEKSNHQDYKMNLKTILDSWKNSVLELYEWLRSDLIHRHLFKENQEKQTRLMSEFLDMTGFDNSEAFIFLSKKSGLKEAIKKLDEQLERIQNKYPKSDHSFLRIAGKRFLIAMFILPLLDGLLDRAFSPFEGTSLEIPLTLLLGGGMFYYILGPAIRSQKGRDKIKEISHEFELLIEQKTQIQSNEIEFLDLGL